MNILFIRRLNPHLQRAFAGIGVVLSLWSSGCAADAQLLPTLMPTTMPPATIVPTIEQAAPSPTPMTQFRATNIPVSARGDTESSTTATPVPLPIPTPMTYVVQEGDSLSLIADKFGIDTSTLMEVNNLFGDSLIHPGQELIIPPAVDSDKFELPLHVVKPGETMFSIAAKYGVTAAALQQANSQANLDILQIGQLLQIPISLGEVHYTIPGDTLLALATRYNTDVDALLLANPAVLDLGDPDFVPVGVLLQISQQEVTANYDCGEQPKRTQVIEHVVSNGEKLFCLGSKFALSVTTLLRSNPHIIGGNALRDGVTIRVPPTDGALYEITPEDISRGTKLQDLLQWYGMVRFDDIVDWNGNSVSEPLHAGQKLFLRNADLLAGDYEAEPEIIAEAIPAMIDAPNDNEQADDSADDEGVAAGTTAVLPEAVRPRSNPWSGEMTDYDTGYCGGVADGYGWSGSLIWPVKSTKIRENRSFRPGHGAIDIEISLGSPVYAADAGEVVWAGYSRWGGGHMVVIAHGNTRQTHYAHLSAVAVACGQAVNQGQAIGQVGQTGASNFPHLHFEVRYGGFSYDPLNWLP